MSGFLSPGASRRPLSSREFGVPRLGYSGIGAVAYLLAQMHDAAVPFAMPMLVVACLLGVLRGAIEFSSRPSGVEISLFVLAGVWLVSACAGVDAQRSLSLSMPLIALLLLVPSIAREPGARDAIAAMEWSVAALATVWSAGLIADAASGGLAPSGRVLQANAPWLVVPNDLAFVAVLWPAWIRRAAGAGIGPGVLLGAMLALQFLALATLHSRLGVALCAISLLLAALAHCRGSISTGLRWVLSGGLLVFLLLLMVPGIGLRSAGARWELWEAGLRVFARYPWLGAGPHNYVLEYRVVSDSATEFLDPRITPWPHSLPIELLAELGIFGCLATMILISCALLRASRRTWCESLPASAVPFLLLCLMEASTLRAWFWGLVLIWLALANRYRIQD